MCLYLFSTPCNIHKIASVLCYKTLISTAGLEESFFFFSDCHFPSFEEWRTEQIQHILDNNVVIPVICCSSEFYLIFSNKSSVALAKLALTLLLLPPVQKKQLFLNQKMLIT